MTSNNAAIHSNPTQEERLLAYLSKHNKGITQFEALTELGIMRLASRISSLKRQGYSIETKFETVNTRYGKASVARYSLLPDVQEAL